MEPRKRKKVDNVPGHAHALTFSTYRRRPHLMLPGVAEILLARLDAARRKHRFEVWAFCVMPEHVHIVLYPLEESYSMATMDKAMESPSATEVFERYPHLRSECQVERTSSGCGRRGVATIGTSSQARRSGRRSGTSTTTPCGGGYARRS